MPAPHRLTRQDLNDIQAGNRRHPDVKLLLAEIRIYREILNNCWQVFDTLPAAEVNSRFDLLRGLINNEPCVKEQRADRERIGCDKIAGK